MNDERGTMNGRRNSFIVHRSSFIVFLLARAVFAQDLNVATIGDLTLDSGAVIHDCKVGYRTYGDPKSKALVVTTWFAGTTKSLASSIGPGKLYDTDKYYVISIDALGDGVSSGLPEITMRDMVRSQHELLTRVLHIDHVYAISGLSMGGMQTFQWLASYPDFMDKAVPIAGTPKQTSYDLLFWKLQLQILQSGVANPIAILATLNTMHLNTPSYIASHTQPEAVDALIASRIDSLKALDAANYASQVRAMISHDVGPIASKAKVLVIVALQDETVNPGPAREWARANGAGLVTLSGDCGHLATACEGEVMRREVQRFLDR